MIQLLALLLVLNFSGDAHLITNGDFEQDLSQGWTQSSSGSSVIINRATTYDPDPDYEVQVYKGNGSGYALIYQIINIVTTDLEFNVDAKFDVAATSSAWSGASVTLKYLNSNGVTLGLTRIYRKTTYCPWYSSNTSHLIEAVDQNWNNYTFNLDSELVNLPGVNPLDISQVAIILLDTCYYC